MILYSTAQVADILKMKPSTVRKYILQKQIKASFVGKNYLVKEDDLEKFINSTQQH